MEDNTIQPLGSIDLNCDMGEGFGMYSLGNDAALMALISSANIACGFHAGDPSIMIRTVKMAIEQGVAVGAHPSFPDLQGFGRREMNMSPKEVFDICMYQIAAIHGMARALGTNLHHVKPHGALYNMAAKDAKLAQAVADATKAIDPHLLLYGLSGSCLISEAEKVGLSTVSEVFADRTYQNDGSLTPRTQNNALISSQEEALAQVLSMVQKGVVIATDGTEVSIKAETICIHGDGANALSFAGTLHKELLQNKIEIRALS